MIDLTYHNQGIFTLFIPESKAGEDAWRQIAQHTSGTGKILSIHLDSILSQLRLAGYKVRKGSAPSSSIDSILAELEA